MMIISCQQRVAKTQTCPPPSPPPNYLTLPVFKINSVLIKGTQMQISKTSLYICVHMKTML